jgi:uncharacterized membrane protein YqjE
VSSGLFSSVQKLLASLLGLASTRLDLLSTELEEALAHFALGIIVAVAALLLATLGIAFAGAAVVIAIAPEYRVAATAVIAMVLLAAGGALAFLLRSRTRRRVFEASLAELRRDREELAP